MLRKYDKTMMNTAYEFAKCSYCKKRKVGAVLVKDGRILATGYNGTISGLPNKCEVIEVECNNCGKIKTLNNTNDIEFTCECGVTYKYDSVYLESKKFKTSEFTLHAEQNTITYCAKKGISTEDGVLYTTTSPCKQCAKLIAQSGIKEVVYDEVYKDSSGLEFLINIGIIVRKYKKDV